jgi:hypothetical protein
MSMRKYYEIGGRRITLKSSVHTWFLYKGEFGRELSEVISRAIALDELRQKESDSEKRAVFLGEEYRLWMSLLWAFAAEGTPDLAPFGDWIQTVGGVDLADVVTTVSELYTSTLNPDRRFRGGFDDDDDENDDKAAGGIVTEALVNDLLGVGFTLSDLRDVTIGQAINLINEHIRGIKRSRGEKETDPEEQYKALKEAVELVESGQVENYDPKALERAKRKLRKWENG